MTTNADRTETSIANMAADFLDSSPVGNIADNFGEAIIYRRNYREAVETVLSEFPWNAATTRAELQPVLLSEDAALSQFDYQTGYAWPVDCLAPIDINGRPIEDIRWVNETLSILDGSGNVVGRQMLLLCDAEGPIMLRYKCVTDPRNMSPHMAKAVAIELAIRCCTKLANSTSKMQELQVMYAETTKGSTRRVGGFQVDSRANRDRRPMQQPSTGARNRAGFGL